MFISLSLLFNLLRLIQRLTLANCFFFLICHIMSHLATIFSINFFLALYETLISVFLFFFHSFCLSGNWVSQFLLLLFFSKSSTLFSFIVNIFDAIFCVKMTNWIPSFFEVTMVVKKEDWRLFVFLQREMKSCSGFLLKTICIKVLIQCVVKMSKLKVWTSLISSIEWCLFLVEVPYIGRTK